MVIAILLQLLPYPYLPGGVQDGMENCFTIHRNRFDVVKLYGDHECRHVRMVIKPDVEESCVGVMLKIKGMDGKVLMVDVNGDTFYVKPGKLAVNTSNYDKAKCFLQFAPDEESELVGSFNDSRTLKIYGWDKGWIFTRTRIGRKKVEGWVAPDLQCANPYTMCVSIWGI